jgi:glycosyltransferase involved in cell wall biosynthesis
VADRTRILCIQYTNPAAYPPVEHAARLLARSGCAVRVLGTGAPNEPLAFRADLEADVRLMRAARAGWRQKLHYLAFAAWVVRHAVLWRANWIYASDPLSCPVALGLSYLPGVGVVYQEHDSPRGLDAARSLFMRTVLGARRRLAGRARLCVLPSEERTRAFSNAMTTRHVATVWNTPMLDEVIEGQRRTGAGPLRLWFHGSIVPARLPLSLVDALGRVPRDVTLEIVGYETAGHPGYVAEIRRRAALARVADRVTVSGPMPRHELLTKCSTADVGVALMPLKSDDVNERHMVGASNKPFDYMARGLALLVPALPAWRAAFVDRGFARECDPESVEDLADAIGWFHAHRAETVAMGECGRAMIRSEWNYERAFQPVLSALHGEDARA